ncbi:MAG: hypothetical protein OYH76_03535 [Defluviicoccus sp.]|nr:hypothetical protein [Defluviicoccus sp.]MDE0274944.1 hypothetical protein [Defluviicoccus sp.]
MGKTDNMHRIGTIAAIAAAALLLGACSSNDNGDDSAKVSNLEADLEAAERALSDLRAEGTAWLQYSGLHSSNRISSADTREFRADDGSTLTIEFQNRHADRPDLVLDRAADDPPQFGEWRGERFERAGDPQADPSAKNVAVLYRTPLGAEGHLVYGWWQTEMSNSSGRSWFDDYGQLFTVTGDLPLVRDITGLQGRAIFEGHAAGIYAISNPAEGQNEGGEFTADASLTIDIADGSATGTIDNFVAAGDPKEWTVSLLRQEFDPDRGFPGFVSAPGNGRAEVQWTISADQTTPGNSQGNWWNGFLFEDRTDETMGAIGGFHAQYTNIGRMTGTYGVKRQ